jgi:hypothetical protein
MLSLFTTPKPFRGHVGVIQRNALRSWTLLAPDVEVILFGDEPGAAEVARELGLRHEPEVRRNEFGTKYLAYFFDRAQEVARHDLLCYVNCDIVLTTDFRRALERVLAWRKQFLMVGQRWDADIAEPLDFSSPSWEERVRRLALETNHQRPPEWIDYFVFPRGQYHHKIPGFVIGRPGWDNWLVWFACHSKVAVVDASPAVVAVHQNHDYSYHPDGEKGVWQGAEAQRNRELLGGWWRFGTIQSATHVLLPDGIQRNRKRWTVLRRRAWNVAWYRLLDVTKPVRHKLRLRRGGFAGRSAGQV